MYEFSGFRLDLRSRRLLRGDAVVPITVKAFETLAALVEQAGAVVDKDELMRRVWPDAIVEEANLSQQIFLLRKTLGEGPKDHRYIQTVPRRGYRFVAPVEKIDAPSQPPQTPAAHPVPLRREQTLRLTLLLSADTPLALGASPPLALSPDGRTFAYIAREGESTCLHIRPLDGPEPLRVPRSEGATAPFFSPDSRWIGYFANGRLYKTPASGGTPIGICAAGSECRGASWTRRDEIVFAATPASGLWVVPADGGAPREATTLDFGSGERTHRWPNVLPNGTDVLLTVARAGSASFDDAEIVIASLDTGARRVLLKHGSCARYVPTGHLVYTRGNSIMAVAFDLERLAIRGSAMPVVEHVMTQPTGAGHFTYSETGCLVYLTGDAHEVKRRLVWANQAGLSEPLRIPEQAIEEPRLSPDGRRIAFGVRGVTSDIWVHDFEQRTLKRVTFEGDNFAPIWTPDGTQLTFSSNRHGPCHIFWQHTTAGEPSKILGGDHDLVPGSWSPDGEALLFTEYNPQTGAGIWMCTPHGQQPPRPLIRSRTNQFSPTLAPDGRSLAFTSDESGHLEVYVSPFPAVDAQAQISLEGGSEPVWARDGRRLYYRSGSSVMAVDINGASRSPIGVAQPVAEGPYQEGVIAGLPNYDVAADGRLLMIAQTAAQARPDRLSVVVNWFADLVQRLA